MRPDLRSMSFAFHSNDPSTAKENAGLTRQCLEQRYDKEHSQGRPNPGEPEAFRAPLAKSWRSNFSLTSLSATAASSQQTGKRVLRSGTDKLTRTFSSVRISIDELTQRLRRSTRRRYRMSGESPKSPKTPGTRARHILGRTPTKMYSPFSIDTPRQKRLASRTPTNIRNQPGCSKDLGPVHSPHNRFAGDVAAARKGIADFERTSQDIVRRSLRN